VNKDFANIVPKVLCWLRVNFTPLRDPHLGYEQQDHIDPYHVEMASMAMIHFGLDPGKFVSFLSREYTGQYQDVRCTLNAIQDHVTSDDYGHIKQILLDGCPVQLTFKEPSSNKLEFMSRGNSKSFVENPQLVQKTMNKEDRYSHLVPMDLLLCKLSPYLRHTMQSIVIKDGKNDRIVWDGSTVTRPTDIVMNQVTPVAKEAPVTFGHVKSQIYMDIYNTCISNPTAMILLGLADVKACFRYPRIHADLTGAFSFITDELFNLATAMVFGSTASASSWEVFRQAIKALTKVFANRPNLVVRHKKLIDMLKWEEIDPSTELTPAFSCTINRGIIDDAGNWMDLPARIYVNNALMLSLNVDHMKMVLAATIKAIFVVMGEPDVAVRQCPLAMDKWIELVIGPKQTMLGLIIDTNRLTISIPAKYLQEVLDLLNSTWHPNRRCFKVSQAQKLTGKLTRLTKGANWVFHLLSHLYSMIAYALSKNKRLLTESSAEFRDIVLAIQANAFITPCKDLAWHTSFAMKQAAKLTHHASYQYNINKTMRYEIEFFCNKLKPDSGIE
jgi:hypothetical protein